MLAIRPSGQFKKDLKKAKKQGRSLEALKLVTARSLSEPGFT